MRRKPLENPLLIKAALLALTALLCAAGPAPAQQPQEQFIWFDDQRGPFELRAEQLTAREGGRYLSLKGGVRIDGQGLRILADRMEVDTLERKVSLSGQVRVIEGARVLLTEQLDLDRRRSEALMIGATVLYKRGVDPADLLACDEARDLERTGRNTIRLDGERWRRLDGRYLIDRVRFTLCDCGPDEAPTWSVHASDADVLPDERAWLSWPVIHLKGVPVFGLPVAYLPLSERRTGLLMPQFNYSGRDGFILSESLFVTLGEQADTTASLDWIEERGLRQRLELRAAPARATWLSVRFSHLSDAKAAEEALVGLRVGRQRYSAEADARADFDSGLAFRADLSLYSDSDMVRDFQSDLAGRAAEYAQSEVALLWRGADLQLALDAAYRQDMRLGAVDLFSDLQADRLERWGLDPVGDTIQRLGAFSLDLAPSHPFGWPVLLSLRLEGANLSSLQAAWRDWGPDGTPDPREPAYADVPADGDRDRDNGAGGEANGLLDSGELRRAFRFLFEPNLSWPLALGRFLRLSPHLAHRQLVYLPHGPDAPGVSTRGMSFAGLSLATELSRGYGEGAERIGHTITPEIDLVGVWTGARQGEEQYLDLWDRLLEDGFQMQVGLSTALHRPDGDWGFARFFSLQILQNVDLLAGALAQTVGRLELDLAPLRSFVRLAVDPRGPELVEVDLGLTLFDLRGDALRISYLYLPSSPAGAGPPMPLSERTQREPGLLFGLAPLPLRAVGDGLHVIGLDGALVLPWGFKLSGGVNLNLRDVVLNWYGGGLAYTSDCHCFGAALSFRMYEGQRLPDFFLLLDLGLLGRARGGTATRF